MADPGINAAERPIPARRFVADFNADTPRHWCGGDPVLTHMLNAYTLLVPGNEGYYIRTLRRWMPRIQDPAMRLMVAQLIRWAGLPLRRSMHTSRGVSMNGRNVQSTKPMLLNFQKLEGARR